MSKFLNNLPYIKDRINRSAYNNDEELTTHPQKKNLDKFIYQNILGTAFFILTTGIFLSGYLIELGASDSLVSYISIINPICGVFVIFFVNWVQSRSTRRRIVTILSGFSKTFTTAAAFVPLVIPNKELWVPVSFGLVLLGNILATINGINFNTWLVAIVPKNILGRYFGVRHMFNLIISIVIPICASFLLDFISKVHTKFLGFFCIFIFASICGFSELVIFSKIDDVNLKKREDKVSIIDCFIIPIKNKPFMNFVFRAGLIHLAFYSASTFHQVYLIRYLNLSYSYINIVNVISPIVQVFIFLKFWGIVTDKVNSGFVYLISSAFFALDMFMWGFVTSKTVVILYPIIQIVASIEWSGFNITSFNRRYEFVPEEDRVLYDSFYTFFIGIVLFLCPLVSTLIRGLAENISFLDMFEFGKVRILFFISSLACALIAISNFTNFIKSDEGKCMKVKSNYEFCLTVLKAILVKAWKPLGIVLSIIVGSSIIIFFAM